MKRIFLWTLLALALGCGMAQAATITVDAGGGADHANLGPAILAAAPGDIITVADGTYLQTGQLNVDKALTIQGASEAGVIVDCTAVTGYGFSVYASDVTMENLTILANTPYFPIHASGTSNPPDGFDNLTLRHLTVTGAHQRTGFDIHGYNNVVLSYLTSSGATGGNGLQVTGCVGVAMDNITTSGNAWGSIAVYVSGAGYLARGSDNVVIDGATLSAGEDYVFFQDEGGFSNGAVGVTGWNFHVRNSRFREPAADSGEFTVLRDDLAHAAALALAIPFPEESTILDLTTGGYAVVAGMGIQAAIDAAASGGAVDVDAGTYREQLFIDKDLTLTGSGMGTTTLEAPDAADRTTYGITTWTGGARTLDPVIGVLGANVSISGFTVDGRDTGPDDFYGIHFHDAGGSVTGCTVDNITYPGGPGAQRVVSIAFSHGAVAGPFTVDVSDNVVPIFQKGGILVMGPEMVFTVERNQVSAYPTPDIAGNGIQLSYGATGTTSANVVSGVGYTGTGWAGTGVLLFESGDVTMTGDTVTGSQSGVNYSDWRWIYSHAVPVNLEFNGLVLTDNEWSFSAQLSGEESDLNLVMDGCVVTGSTGDAIDVYGTGLDPWGGSYYTGWNNGDLDVAITGLTVDNTAIDGIWTADDSGNASNTVHGFSVTGSSFTNTAGSAVANLFGATIDAPRNYWGDPAGPTVGAKAVNTKAIAPLTAPAGFDLPKAGRVGEVPTGPGEKAAGTVTGPVDFSPWFGLPLGTSPMIIGTNDVIGDAVDLAVAGDSITVAAGHYEEQLHIATDDLTITGAGAGASFVDAPASMPLFFTTSAANYPIVFVDGATGTSLSGLTIDGRGNGLANYRFCGLGLDNADGTYTDLHVTRVRNEPLDGSQHGNGLYVINSDAAARTVVFTDVVVDDIQKNATVFDGAGLTVNALRLTCTGSGPLGVGLPAQNGIQVSGGAHADLTDCVIAGFDYTDPSWTASGLLVFGPGSADVHGGSITSTKTSIYYIDASGDIDGITVTNPIADPMYAYAGAAKAAGGTIVQPQGFDVAAPGKADKAAIAVTLTNSTFIGNDTVDSWGPTAWAEGSVDFTVTGCVIEHFDYGLCLYEDGGTVTGSASGSFLRDNLGYGAWSNTVVPFDARGNDWGHISGPFHPTLNAGGLGNEVSDNILFEPWTGQAGLDIVPATSGPLACGQPLSMTFRYTADDVTPDMFLYNLIVAVPPQLTFNSVTDEMPFGTVNNNFFVTDNLDGTWTFTGSTVGSPTSPVVGPGTFDLFTIHFVTAMDGAGAVTFADYVFRDPVNAPIPAGASGAAVSVDCTPPAAVTGITAMPGHNKVDVSWNHDGIGVDHYEVFVAKWGDGGGASAYPEYDDLPADVIPGRPADYLSAVLLPAWVPQSPVPAPAMAMTQTWPDHLGRGVYYYEVFAVDDVGNGSPRAAANDRSTNYWLGDVYGAPTVLIPNGLVNVQDISYMAARFGDPVAIGEAHAVCDVGPTDDWSRLGIPLTDSVINFEDLMVFSMNFGVVTAAKDMAPVSDRIDLAWVDYGDGRYGLRLVDGNGLKGLRVTANAEVSLVEAGTLLDEQGEPTFLRNLGAGLDASVAVMGVNNGFTGSGDLMVVDAGQVISPGDLAITARGTDNSELEVSLAVTSGTLTPRVFALHPNYPNPFNPMTKISFSLPEAQSVILTVYAVDGRRVATLVNETRSAGLHEVIWNGQDDLGRQSASGVYFCRIDAGPYSQVRKMALMK